MRAVCARIILEAAPELIGAFFIIMLDHSGITSLIASHLTALEFWHTWLTLMLTAVCQLLKTSVPDVVTVVK